VRRLSSPGAGFLIAQVIAALRIGNRTRCQRTVCLLPMASSCAW
jgi:hypothetical protein